MVHSICPNLLQEQDLKRFDSTCQLSLDHDFVPKGKGFSFLASFGEEGIGNTPSQTQALHL